jgi:hypothetical protein
LVYKRKKFVFKIKNGRIIMCSVYMTKCPYIDVLGQKINVWDIEEIQGKENTIEIKLKGGKNKEIPCEKCRISDVIDDIFVKMADFC